MISKTDSQDHTLALPVLRAWDGAMTRELALAPAQLSGDLRPLTLRADAVTTSVCGYCSTGCGLSVQLRDRVAIGLTPAAHYPVNLGSACPKGWEALRVLDAADRASVPLLRDEHGTQVPITWDQAFRSFCERVKDVQHRFGPESVAFISTGQIATEEMMFLGALAKFGMGLVHGDGNTRQCMATAATAYKESFGFDAPPYTYEDLELSDCMVFIGANPCLAHPILWERALRNQRHPEIIAIDPRRTETAMAATQHLQLRPKSDLVLLYGIANYLIDHNFIQPDFIAAHTEGYSEFCQHVARFTLKRVSVATGLATDVIQRAAEAIGTRSSTSFWWTMGVNQSYEGTRTAQAIINLALMTGNLGRPGTGANSITGQCNAMGSRLWSNTTNLFGGRRFEVDSDRQQVADILGIDAERIPKVSSWSYERILEGIDSGSIHGLWVIATNTSHSWIGQNETQRRLESLDFLCVQDMYTTSETAKQADLVLPAAGWGEKEGTFINSERRYGTHKKVRRAPGQALADFQIFRGIASYWGCDEMFRDWRTPEDVFQSIKALSQGRPCDITGIDDYAFLDQNGGVQWPWTENDAADDPIPQTHRRLFADGKFFTSNGRAKFISAEPTSSPEPPDASFPLLLLTGRGSASQWHTQTRTSKSPILRQLYPADPYVEIHPDDADRLKIAAGQWVRVSSRRGVANVVAVVTNTVAVGQVFMPMHDSQTNRLTLPHYDPYSRQPSYKDCAVRIDTRRQKPRTISVATLNH